MTNLARTAKKALLLIYKYQPYVEKRFAHYKTDLEVATVYLKKPRRVAALLDAYFVALMLDALIERRLRAAMRVAGLDELPLLPEGRPTKTPPRRASSRCSATSPGTSSSGARTW